MLILEALTLILLVLKLLGHLEWSWLAVFLPLVASFMMYTGFVIGILAATLRLSDTFDKLKEELDD